MGRGRSSRTLRAALSDTRQADRLNDAVVAMAAGIPDAGPRLGLALEAALIGPRPSDAIGALATMPNLDAALPAIAAMVGFDQRSPYHPEGDLFLHTQQVLERIAILSDDPDLRWAALYHDTGKPGSLWVDEAGVGHFYAHPERGNEDHEVISARLCERDLARMGLPAHRRARICALVGHHMRARFGSVRGARRFIASVGPDLVEPLLLHRHADHEGDGDPAVHVARMRDLCARALAPEPDERVRLAVTGKDLMFALRMKPGPALGALLGYLTREVAAGRLPDEPDALIAAARDRV